MKTEVTEKIMYRGTVDGLTKHLVEKFNIHPSCDRYKPDMLDSNVHGGWFEMDDKDLTIKRQLEKILASGKAFGFVSAFRVDKTIDVGSIADLPQTTVMFETFPVFVVDEKL